MSDVANTRKQLRIKAGSAKRLYKEQRMYQKEQEDLQRKLDKHIAEKAEDWDINNTGRMLAESGKMITDASTRLGAVVQELRELVLVAEQNPELSEAEELVKARETLEEVSV
ncbi:tubulin binding cofactor A [Lenzites betulinus]|nr:tubulin binding cofactor A [Lenzites betulinus]